HEGVRGRVMSERGRAELGSGRSGLSAAEGGTISGRRPMDGPPRANVLVADDRPANVLAIQQVLEPLKHNVMTAASGEEVLRSLLTNEFAVILLDVQMPIMDGFEVATQIKRREKTRHIPIIFLTAVNQDPSDIFQ